MVDYAEAWQDLAERLRAKPGWGTKELHALMVDVAADHKLPEHFVKKIVRLYGDTIHLSISSETEAAAPGESDSPTAERKHSDPEPSTSKETHDERVPEQHHREARPDQGTRAGSSGRRATAAAGV